MPRLDRSATVAELVLEHPSFARVFQRHRIDFCCGGDVSVEEACRGRPVEAAALLAELEAALPGDGRSAEEPDPRTLSTRELVDLIVLRHHGYLREALPSLEPLLARVARVHRERGPKLASLADVFGQLREALEPHLRDEEERLFPALTRPAPDLRLARGDLARMREEHLAVGALLSEVRSLAGDFAVPEWGCNSYRVLMAELEALETDLLHHVHLENHVLMPRFAEGAEAAC